MTTSAAGKVAGRTAPWTAPAGAYGRCGGGGVDGVHEVVMSRSAHVNKGEQGQLALGKAAHPRSCY